MQCDWARTSHRPYHATKDQPAKPVHSRAMACPRPGRGSLCELREAVRNRGMHIRVSIDTFVALIKQKRISMYNPLFSWHLDIPVVIGLLAAECIYVLLVRRLWHKAGRYDMRSALAWSIGVAVIFIALESPLDSIGEERLLS